MSSIQVSINGQSVGAGDNDGCVGLMGSIVSAREGPMQVSVASLVGPRDSSSVVTGCERRVVVGDTITLQLAGEKSASTNVPREAPAVPTQNAPAFYWEIKVNDRESIVADLKGLDQIQAQLTWPSEREECDVKIASVSWQSESTEVWIDEKLKPGDRITIAIHRAREAE